MVLVGGLKRALNEPAAIVFKGVRIRVDGERVGLQGHHAPRREPAAGRAAPARLVRADGAPAARRRRPATEIDLAHVSREQLGALEAELTYTKENLQAAIEELETSNEELQASNEELQPSNEELQSTNEELQSVNEELYTVNAEYQRKIARAHRARRTTWTTSCRARTSAPSSSIGSSGSGSSRRRSPRASTCVPHDVGRSIETFTHKMDHPELDRRSAARARHRRAGRARAARIATGKSFFLRSCRTAPRATVDGVVHHAHRRQRPQGGGGRALPRALPPEQPARSVPDAIYFKDARGRFIRANHAMATRLGLDDPARRGRQDGLRAARPRARRSRCTSRTRWCSATGEAQHYKLEKRRPRATAAADWDLVDAAAAARRRRAASSASSRSSATSPSRSAPRRRSRRRCAGATSSSPCCRTSCAIRSARS